MTITLRNQLVAATATTVIFGSPAVLASASSPTAPSATAAARAAARAAPRTAATRYWTRARMEAAVPLGGTGGGDTASRGLRWVRGGAVAQATGKVFFTLNDNDYVCSGSAVSSPHADLVLTAAHCVSDGQGNWASNWMFVPGYADGMQPYGAYTARRFFVSPRWTGADDSESYDVAFVTVNPATLYGATPHVTTMPGAFPASFGAGLGAGLGAGSAAATYVFGYPSQPPFSGLYLDYCAGQARVSVGQGFDGVPCGMTAGDSGGPWLAGFSPSAGTGTIVAVTTFKYSDDSRLLYGTELGTSARALYQEASASLTPAR
jgi:hypothetical protein